MTKYKTALSLLLSVILLTFKANSEVLRWPQLCSSGKLTVTNSSSQVLRGWIQKFSDGRRFENEIFVQAFSRSVFSIQTSNSNDRFTLLHFSDTQKISAVLSCEKSNLSVKAHSLEGGFLNFASSDLSENKIWLQNLFSGSNTIHFNYLDQAGKVMAEETLSLSSNEQKNYKSTLSSSRWSRLKIWGDNRFTAFSLISSGARGPASVQPQVSWVDANASYFLVGPREGQGDTFIARMTDSDLIARARELILHPEYEKMLFAKIEKGHQGYNRNWSKPEKSFWSWSVTEVTNFADIGSTACNGLPQLVEDDVDLWVQNPGRICFWNYRVQKELSPQEITQEAP